MTPITVDVYETNDTTPLTGCHGGVVKLYNNILEQRGAHKRLEMSASRSLTVAFLTYPVPTDSSFRQKLEIKLVHYIVGKFDHVELIFENVNQPGDFFACSVLHQGTVFFKEKGFSREGYQYLTISGLNPDRVKKIQDFCYKEAVDRGVFSESAFYRAGSPFANRSCGTGHRGYQVKEWFCSQLVTTALQQGGLMKGYLPGSMTPSSIYDALLKTIPKENLHKGINPFFDYNINCRLQHESQKLLAGTTPLSPGASVRIQSKSTAQVEKQSDSSILQKLLAHKF